MKKTNERGEEWWLERASQFEVDGERFSTSTDINRRSQIDGTVLWAVNRGPFVLSKNRNEFILEPQPSSRDGDFLKDTRFDSKEEALFAYLKYKEEQKHYSKSN